MELTINSRAMNQGVTFSRPGSGNIFVDLTSDGSRPGTLGMQICRGGATTGDCISYYGDDQIDFDRICRNWFRAYRNAK